MLKKQKTEQVVKWNRWLNRTGGLPTSRKDRFFNFNIFDQSKSNFRKLKKSIF